MRTTVLWVLALALAGCGGAGARTIVSSKDVSGAGGAPSVSKVTDLGEMAVMPADGKPLPTGASDGTFVVGELVLIEGDDFGKLPAVNIGGRPAEPLARTGNGGIVARIPPGIATGKTEVEVSHRKGRGSRAIDVIRYGLLVEPATGTVHLLKFDGSGPPTAAGSLSVPGARDVAFSHDGSAAYVAADAAGDRRSAGLGVIALGASGGPKLLRLLRLSGTEASRVVTASKAPTGVVVGGGKMTLVGTGNGSSPSLYDAIPVTGVDGPKALAISPDGSQLALLSATGNLLLPVDLSNRSAPRPGPAVPLLADIPVPMLIDLGYAPKGDELWVIAGDNREALVAGQHPPRLVDLDVATGGLTVDRSTDVDGIEAPIAVAVARREAIGSATAIRSTARKAAIVCTSVERAVVEDAVAALAQRRPFGLIARTDLDGKSEPLWRGEGVPVDVDLTHDGRTSVAAVAMVSRDGTEVGHQLAAVVTELAGGEPTVIQLGSLVRGAPPLGGAAVALAP